MALGHYVDGRASFLVGTHTHVPTADHQILPGGTAYVTDAGMCGDYDIRDRHGQGGAAQPVSPQDRARPLQPGDRPCHRVWDCRLTDDATGLAMAIAPVRLAAGSNRPAAMVDSAPSRV